MVLRTATKDEIRPAVSTIPINDLTLQDPSPILETSSFKVIFHQVWPLSESLSSSQLHRGACCRDQRTSSRPGRFFLSRHEPLNRKDCPMAEATCRRELDLETSRGRSVEENGERRQGIRAHRQRSGLSFRKSTGLPDRRRLRRHQVMKSCKRSYPSASRKAVAEQKLTPVSQPHGLREARFHRREAAQVPRGIRGAPEFELGNYKDSSRNAGHGHHR